MGTSGGKGFGFGDGSGGLSSLDVGEIMNAMQLGQQGVHNRYAQLGIGVPSGSPVTAAKTGTNLTYGGPSTAETTDMSGLQFMANAALGQLQNQNMSNPAIAGTPANQIQQNQQFSQLANDLGFGTGFFGGL